MVNEGEVVKEEFLYKREVVKDLLQIKNEKNKFIQEVLSGLGDNMNNIETYKKKAPSKLKIFWRRLKLVLWNV